MTASAKKKVVRLADISREAYIYLGAGATVLRQMANPGVGLGVAEHSITLLRPLDRLRSTMDYIYVVTLGTDDERRAIAQRVNRAHIPVRSAHYNAFDPQLQLWVAATLYKGAVELYELFNGPLDDSNHEMLYHEAAIYGTTLQVDKSMWPANRAAFEVYWEASQTAFDVPDSVRVYVHQLLRGGASPWYIKILMPVQRFMTRALLTPAQREFFGLSWSVTDQKLWRCFTRCVPPFYRLMPRAMRRFPSRMHMRSWRKRVKNQHKI